MKMGKKIGKVGSRWEFWKQSFSKSGFVAVFGTFIEANLVKKQVNSWFGELFKIFKKLWKNSENITKIIKHSRNWVEVGPNETWIGQIDAEFYFLAIPHHKNSQK